MALKATVSTKTKANDTKLAHNDRTPETVHTLENKAAHIDEDRTYLNKTLIKKDMHEMFDELFQPEVDKYNQKQKRKSRQIDNYWDKVDNDKNLELFHEDIVQFGNTNFWNKNFPNHSWATSERDNVIAGFKEYLDWYQEEYPYMHVHDAVIHMDEGSPHMQIVYIPKSDNYKNGVKSQPGFNHALKEHGLSFADYQQSQYDKLAEVMDKHLGIQHRIGDGSHDDLSLGEYKSINKQQEELDTKIKEADALKRSYEAQKRLLSADKDLVQQNYNKASAMHRKAVNKNFNADLTLEDVDKREKIMNERVNRLIVREGNVAKRETAVKTREDNVKTREDSVSTREDNVTKREKAVKKATDAMHNLADSMKNLLANVRNISVDVKKRVKREFNKPENSKVDEVNAQTLSNFLKEIQHVGNNDNKGIQR